MEANELRLLNYLLYKDNIVQIVGIDMDLEDECIPLIKVDTFEYEKNPLGGRWRKYIEYNETHFVPIPLTEEWLLKFGFEDRNILGFFSKDSFTIHFGQKLVFYKGDRVLKNFDNLEFVHQLQNLFFVLTGEELILNK